jgi:cbb3-type cytochrome oxidase subunit 3
MKSDALSQFNLPALSVAAMVVFIAIFAVVVYQVYRKKNKPYYDEAARIPLSEDTDGVGSSHE